MLQELRKVVPQKSYDGKMSLLPLLQTNVETIEGRVELLFKTIELIDGLYTKELEDGEVMPNIQYIKEQIAKAHTYYTDRSILGHILFNICKELSFELIKENNNVFDYGVAEEAAKGKRPYTDFVLLSQAVTLSNVIWAFSDKEGNQYSGKWIKDGIALKNNQLEAILAHYSGDNEEVTEAVKFILDPANEKLVKKTFKQRREVLVSAFKLIISPDGESKVLEIFRKQK